VFVSYLRIEEAFLVLCLLSSEYRLYAVEAKLTLLARGKEG
jgi:hypothetical protein